MLLRALLVVALFTTPLLAQAPPRVEYGKAHELQRVEAAWLWTAGDAELDAEARRQLSALLPTLALAETEGNAGVTLILQRKAGEGSGDAAGVVTTLRVARGTGTTIRLYLDASSRDADLGEAVAEALTPFAVLLHEANPRRYPPVEGVAWKRKYSKPTVHSTAGLHPGLSKRDVLAALGAPGRIDGRGARTQTWTYTTTDGQMRLVFGGDRLISVTFPDTKK
jgi:hypothetical protein